MTRTYKTLVTIILIALLLCVSSVIFAERVISSQTLVVHAYIPARTTVAFDTAGNLLFTTNSTNVSLSVVETSTATLLNVIAR
jgi:hypothetical protein